MTRFRKSRMLQIMLLTVMMGLAIFSFGCATSPEEATDESGEEPIEEEIILASTTSTRDSGLLDVLLPKFEQETGYKVKLIAVGTGAALEMGARGNADALLTHAPAAEQELVDDGSVINYQRVMHNDFVVVGPEKDAAAVGGMEDVVSAFQKMARAEVLFLSRGDDSGTNKKELSIWYEAGVEPGGQWYQETGQGMGATLKIASEKQGYTLTDRGTYLNLKDKVDLSILVEGDPMLHNIYHIMQVNPEKFDHINAAGAEALVNFMLRQDVQEIIGEYGEEEFGQPLFYPDRVD